MNQIWPTPPQWPDVRPCTCHQQPCVCGCDEDRDFRCAPEWMENLTSCWKEIARFKKMLEQLITELNLHGSAGPQGQPGLQGPAGPQGPVGPAGLDLAFVGPTAPPSPAQGELWMDTTNQFLMVYETGTGWVNVTGAIPIPGPQGPVGPQGPAGPVGPQGAQGPQGALGPAGAQGAQGAQGLQGLQGQPAFVNGGPGTCLVTATPDNPNIVGHPGSWQNFAQIAFGSPGNYYYFWQRTA